MCWFGFAKKREHRLFDIKILIVKEENFEKVSPSKITMKEAVTISSRPVRI